MENDLVFTTFRTISSAFIDSNVRLGISQAALLVQDNLTEAFGKMGCDGVVFREKHDAFWVFTKTKIHFEKFPFWKEKIVAKTFPILNEGFRTQVNTIFFDENGKTLLAANQEACVLSLKNRRPLRLSNLPYPKENFPFAVFFEPFEKFPKIDCKENFIYEQKIQSERIDMSGHMNNIEYIRLALNVFSCDFLQSHDAADLEVHYTGESREGQTLKIFCKKEDVSFYVSIKEGENFVFEMKIKFNEK